MGELKAKLQSLGQPTKGKKLELIARLAEAAAAAGTEQEAAAEVPPSDAVLAAAEGSLSLQVLVSTHHSSTHVL